MKFMFQTVTLKMPPFSVTGRKICLIQKLIYLVLLYYICKKDNSLKKHTEIEPILSRKVHDLCNTMLLHKQFKRSHTPYILSINALGGQSHIS